MKTLLIQLGVFSKEHHRRFNLKLIAISKRSWLTKLRAKARRIERVRIRWGGLFHLKQLMMRKVRCS